MEEQSLKFMANYIHSVLRTFLQNIVAGPGYQRSETFFCFMAPKIKDNLLSLRGTSYSCSTGILGPYGVATLNKLQYLVSNAHSLSL